MEGDVQGVLSHMIGLMEEEVKAFRNLLDALLEQRKALVQGDEGGFVRSVHRKAEILERTQRLEDEKEEVVRDLAGRLDLPSERPTLPQIISAVEEEYARRLSELRETLLELLRKVHRTSETNRFLIEHALSFVERNIQLLTESKSGDGYGASGKAGPLLVDVEA
ncbi:MAG: hypothetical protein DRQ08_05775 [Candidatus Latescibacterota bacterium]|nr:MAG: hypothetical protein DRP99_03250 [Candidatus Latescibacterota bacterium]RKY65479.1 MAG: hypothetical protein DRQ08_05775 [Candidatus Latescibacterota bacterium]